MCFMYLPAEEERANERCHTHCANCPKLKEFWKKFDPYNQDRMNNWTANTYVPEKDYYKWVKVEIQGLIAEIIQHKKFEPLRADLCQWLSSVGCPVMETIGTNWTEFSTKYLVTHLVTHLNEQGSEID